MQNTESDEQSPVNVFQFQDKTSELDQEALWEQDDGQSNRELLIPIHQDSVLDIFQSIECQIKPFVCVFKTNQQMIVMHKLQYPLLYKLKTICKSNSPYCIIHIKVEQENQMLIRALSGDQQTNEAILKKISNAIFSLSDKHQHLSHIDEIKHQESNFNPFHLESLSVAMIYKYCSNNNNSLDKNDQKYFNNKIVIPQNPTMKQLYELVEQTFEQFIQQQFLNKQQQISQFHILTIEKYIFSGLYDELMNQYIKKLQEKQTQVDLKKKQIKMRYSQEELIQVLEIKNHYLPQIGFPYQEAIKELKQVDLYRTPSEMLRQFQYVLVMIRGVAFSCNQKEEIIAMDDELPILIWVALQSDLINLYAKIQFVDDYIQEVENEKRILTNLRVSLDYISKEWKL